MRWNLKEVGGKSLVWRTEITSGYKQGWDCISSQSPI